LTRQAGTDGESLELEHTEVIIFEQASGQAMRALVDHDRIRLGNRLQPGRQIGRFTDNGKLVHLCGLDQFANNHDAGCDSNAHLKHAM